MHGAGGVYPSMHWAVGVSAWGCVSQHALGRGCLPRGGVCLGVLQTPLGPGADTPLPGAETDTPRPVDRQTTSLAGGNNLKILFCCPWAERLRLTF